MSMLLNISKSVIYSIAALLCLISTNIFSSDYTNEKIPLVVTPIASISTCAEPFEINSTQSTFPIVVYEEQPVTAWFQIIVDPSVTIDFNLKYQTSTAPCYDDKMPISITVFGPFNECDYPCDLIGNGDIQSLYYSREVDNGESVLSNEDLPEVVSPGLFLILMNFDSAEQNLNGQPQTCSFEIKLDSGHSGIIDNFPSLGSPSQGNAYSTISQAHQICDESGNLQVSLANNQSSRVWLSFIKAPSSSINILYNPQLEDNCSWLSNNIITKVYGPFSSCNTPSNSDQLSSFLLSTETTNAHSTFPYFLVQDSNLPENDMTAQYFVEIIYPSVKCSDCVFPISYDSNNLLCDWSSALEQDGTANWSNCGMAYNFCGAGEDLTYFHQGSNEPEIWLSCFMSTNNYASIEFNPEASSIEELADEFSYSITVFGPISECDNSCDVITNTDNEIFDAERIYPGNGNLFLPELSLIQVANSAGSFLNQPQRYFIRIIFHTQVCAPFSITMQPSSDLTQCDWAEPESIEELPCENCLPPFSLEPEKNYVISSWVKIDSTDMGIKTFHQLTPSGQNNVSLKVWSLPQDGESILLDEFIPNGPIIDGWQQINGTFSTPSSEYSASIEMNAKTDVYFDDIRLFPEDGSLKSYVYDPFNLRFIAELDERNFATFYEYDEDGKLARIKKETERGIMTIQETRSSMPKN